MDTVTINDQNQPFGGRNYDILIHHDSYFASNGPWRHDLESLYPELRTAEVRLLKGWDDEDNELVDYEREFP